MADLLMERGAEISACGRYRYLLWRRWDKTKPRMVFIMLNPSTADAETDDATIRVCVGRAMRMGFGGIRVANLFNWRATDPAELRKVDDPVGPEGDQSLWRAITGEVPLVIAAWGQHGTLPGRRQARWGEAVDVLCYDHGITLHALKLTSAGQPCHPLRIPYSTQPFPWRNRNGTVKETANG